jgi:hypothetical protein
MPRDRRGRIAQKTLKGKGRDGHGHEHEDEESDGVLGDGGETPRIGLGGAAVNVDREHEREFLEALRYWKLYPLQEKLADYSIGVLID